MYLGRNSKVTMLGAEDVELAWKHDTPGFFKSTLVIDIPDSLYAKLKNDYAWVFKIQN
jgi:hypothetical protein